MPFFKRSQNIIINNSHFIDNTIYDQRGIDALLRASNPNATYDSSVRHPTPSCFPGTRSQYIEDIIDWAVPTIGINTPSPLFWMRGPAGVGKSAIAQTCVEKLKDMNKLGAAFFFAVDGRDKAAQFFPSIVYQLSIEFPDYRDIVDQQICRDITVLSKTMMTQLRELIVKPLQMLKKNGKGIGMRIPIFIDGLDQCEDADAQCEIIAVIASAARDDSLPFCWAFFSRSESRIEAIFAIPDIAQITSKALLPISRDADSEIELYLRSSFGNILRRRNICMKSQWPSDDEIRALVHIADGLFIFAATALRIIAHSSTLSEPLHKILGADTNRSNASISNGDPGLAYVGLDMLYMQILQRIPPEILSKTLLFLAMMQSDTCYGVMWHGNLLGLSELEFKIICNHLSAVVHFCDQAGPVPSATIGVGHPFQDTTRVESSVTHSLGGSISFYHKSFHDFLGDPSRSSTFCITSQAVRNALFKHCLELHIKYQESYNFEGAHLTLAPGFPDSASSLSYPHTNEYVNSIIKAKVLDFLHNYCLSLALFSDFDSQLLQMLQDIDFRKRLQVRISMYSGQRFLVSVQIWGYSGFMKIVGRTQLFRLLSHDFLRLFNDNTKFQELVEQMQKMGVIQPYHNSLGLWLGSLLHYRSQGQTVTGLYCMGNGLKSILWYWEIDFKLGHFQGFFSVDLDEGERLYQEEDFGLWEADNERDESQGEVEAKF